MNTLTSKTDLLKSDPNYYKASKKPVIVDLDVYYYLTASGQCAPEDPQFHAALEALYKVGYTLKFMMKENDLDFVVPKMEGFWWVDQEITSSAEFKKIPRSQWHWKIMIRLPDFVENMHFTQAQALASDKNPGLSGIASINMEKINEGRAAQILHVGSYEEEDETLAKLYDFIEAEGCEINNHHHEIYLSDPRRTPENKLRTILRCGIKEKSM